MAPLDRKLIRDLWLMRGQVLAVALVMACGVATVVLSLGTWESLRETRDAYYERYRFADVFAQAKRAPEALVRRLEEIPGVGRVETRIVEDALLDMPAMAEPVRARLLSLPETGQPALNGVAVRRGRLPWPGRPDEAVVNEAFAEAHDLWPGDTVSATINGRQRHLEVVGVALSPEYVYAIGPGELVPDDRRFALLWLGREALEAAFDQEGAFNDVSLRLTHGAVEESVLDAVDDLLEPYGGIGAYGRRDHISDSFLRSEMDQLKAMTTIVPPIFLAVAAFLLNFVVGRIVETEREQIGLLKAFGYSNLEVGWHYLKLVLAVAFLGVVLGCLSGVWMGRGMTGLYAEYYRFPILYYRFDPGIFATAALVGVVAAASGALAAVRRAVRLEPAVAMRPPAPTSYRAGVLERLGVTRLLDQPSRMILRNLTRWPLRNGVAAFGVAAAVALLISTLFFLDSLDAMMDDYFFRTQRQDIALTFAEVRPDSVRHELAHWTGVLAVETVRDVAARLRHGHRERRVQITGIDPGSDLSRLLDSAGRPVAVPENGLVMTSKLAELLDAQAGDRVTLEVLEGRRPTVRVPVRVVIEELIGLGAYMDRGALNRLMGDDAVASGARLLVDAADLPAFFATVKETPAVQGVAVQETALQRFRSVMDETMLTMVFFYVVFASLIAIGVVYSNARIALSERGRELATLRVLGFRRGEVTYIFIGGVAATVLVALPLGCVLGYGLAALMAGLFDSELYRLPLVVSPATYGWAVLAVLAAAVATGALMTRRIARLDLVAVLKMRE